MHVWSRVGAGWRFGVFFAVDEGVWWVGGGDEASVAAVLAVWKDGITPGVFEHGRLVLSRMESLNKMCLRVYSMH